MTLKRFALGLVLGHAIRTIGALFGSADDKTKTKSPNTKSHNVNIDSCRKIKLFNLLSLIIRRSSVVTFSVNTFENNFFSRIEVQFDSISDELHECNSRSFAKMFTLQLLHRNQTVGSFFDNDLRDILLNLPRQADYKTKVICKIYTAVCLLQCTCYA